MNNELAHAVLSLAVTPQHRGGFTTTTWLHCALWQMRHWPPFINIPFCSEHSNTMKHCSSVCAKTHTYNTSAKC